MALKKGLIRLVVLLILSQVSSGAYHRRRLLILIDRSLTAVLPEPLTVAPVGECYCGSTCDRFVRSSFSRSVKSRDTGILVHWKANSSSRDGVLVAPALSPAKFRPPAWASAS